MCRWGEWEDVEVTIPADLSCTGKARRKLAKIDRCIAHIVRRLDAQGVAMRGSCCGHGKRPGQILLESGGIIRVETGGFQ
jgi:hypothetical protein